MTDDTTPSYDVVVIAVRRVKGEKHMVLGKTTIHFDALTRLIEWADDSSINFDKKEIRK
jgi:hypothetical protein